MEDEVHAAVGLERPHVQVAPQLADRVDADLVAERLQHVQIGVRAAKCPPRVAADERGAEGDREVTLADSRRAVEEVGVRRFGERGREQALGLDLLGDGFGE